MMTPDDMKLVERLRKGAVEPCDGCCYGESMTAAADRLETLSADLARAQEALNEIDELLDAVANALNARADGYQSRGNTIYNGAIIAEELRHWSAKIDALSNAGGEP